MLITSECSIPDEEISYEFMRSSGPGGQHINKTESAVRLRFNLEQNTTLPGDAKKRLYNLAGKRISKSGVLSIVARNSRRQEKNKQYVEARFIALIQQALKRPKPHKATTPPYSAKLKRLQYKKHRSQIKQNRRSVGLPDD